MHLVACLTLTVLAGRTSATMTIVALQGSLLMAFIPSYGHTVVIDQSFDCSAQALPLDLRPARASGWGAVGRSALTSVWTVRCYSWWLELLNGFSLSNPLPHFILPYPTLSSRS